MRGLSFISHNGMVLFGGKKKKISFTPKKKKKKLLLLLTTRTGEKKSLNDGITRAVGISWMVCSASR